MIINIMIMIMIMIMTMNMIMIMIIIIVIKGPVYRHVHMPFMILQILAWFTLVTEAETKMAHYLLKII